MADRVLYVSGNAGRGEEIPERLDGHDGQFLLETVTSGREALTTLTDGEVDCIVSEDTLPEVDGIELVERVREQDGDVPFVLSIDSGQRDVAAEALSKGATEIVQRANRTEYAQLLATRIQCAVSRTDDEHVPGSGMGSRKAPDEDDSGNRHLLESSQTPVFVYTMEGELIAANGQAADFLGTDHPEELLGTMVGEFTHNKSQAAVERRRSTLVEDRKQVPPREETLVDVTGEQKYAIVSSTPITWEGEPAILTTLRDVTELRMREQQYRRKRDKFLTLFENLPNPVVHGEMVDGEPIIRQVNPAFEETFGYDAEEATGQNLDELTVPADKRSQARDINEQITATSHGRFEVERQTADGPRHFVIDIVVQDPDAETPQGYAIYTDITKQTEQQAELERRNERLDQFASFVSHDLRNPLNTLLLSLDMVEQSSEGEEIERCQRAVERMEQLLEDLLTLTRQGEDLQTTPGVDLAGVVDETWRTLTTGDAELRVDVDLGVRANTGRLKELLENLFDNAIEHGGPDVTITVGATDDTDGFYVADDGPGIPPEERESVFQAGYSNAADGTGLGLAIVRDVADAHGWSISVEESEQGGVAFRITGIERSG